ncbi:Transmembrane 9 superfamily member 7, partial [Choanephora cucurbitarum]
MIIGIVLSLLLCPFVLAYKPGDSIPIYYNKIFSLSNPLTYSYDALSFVCPMQHSSRQKSSLIFDQDLRGDRTIQSDYKINFLENQECKLLCRQAWRVEDAIQAEELTSGNYFAEWELDGMPGATVSYTNEAPEHNYRVGFPLGFKKDESAFINNHVIFQVLYTPSENQADEYDIVGFEVYPDSIADGECTKKTVEYENQEITANKLRVTYTYSVQWKKVEAPLNNRWDAFLLRPNPDRHHYALLNGVAIVLCTFVILIIISLKTVQKESTTDDKDLKVYDDADEIAGWRLISRDVFRRPVYGGLLTPLLGSGIQLISVLVGLMICLQFGWYHPAQPRSLIHWFTFLFILSSVPGGYCSARVYKVFRGRSWTLNSVLTALAFPSIALLVLLIVGVLAWPQQSSLAISFSGWMSFILVWTILVLPLITLGAYYGQKADRIEYPSRTTQIPRAIPAKSWYHTNSIRALTIGMIPFAIIFLNWHELLNSICKGEYTLSISDTVRILVLMLIAVMQTTVISIFLQLCAEDYHWWWQSFTVGASPAVYMLVYGWFYYLKNSEIQGILGGTIYFLYLLLGCSIIGACTGTLGFISAYTPLLLCQDGLEDHISEIFVHNKVHFSKKSHQNV